MKTRGPVRCTTCRQTGHNARTCSTPSGHGHPIARDYRSKRKRPDRGAVTVSTDTLERMRAYCQEHGIGLTDLVDLAVANILDEVEAGRRAA